MTNQPFPGKGTLAKVGAVQATVCAALLLPACGTSSGPQDLAPQSVGRSAPAGDAAMLPGPVVRPEPKGEAKSPEGPPVHGTPKDEQSPQDTSTIVIGGRPTQRRATAATLQAASRSERERRAHAEQPVAVITDENLAEFAAGANVTVGSAPAPLSPEEKAQLQEQEREEQYWRSEALRLRVEWREAYDSLGELEERAAKLRNDFYAADDPFYRDRQIKPAWDRALDQIEEAHETIEAAQRELGQLLDEGRRAGALPGWLREGIELEPEPPEELEDGELGDAETSEPVEIGQP